MKMPLYYGDNEIHEFWESTNHEVLILRNHGEQWWVIFINYKITDSKIYLLQAVDVAAQLVGINLKLTYTHQWTKPKTGTNLPGLHDGSLLLELSGERTRVPSIMDTCR